MLKLTLVPGLFSSSKILYPPVWGGQDRAKLTANNQIFSFLDGNLDWREFTLALDTLLIGGEASWARGIDCVGVSVLVLVHSRPWACCARVANDWLCSGATVLDLPQRRGNQQKAQRDRPSLSRL